MKLDQLQEAKTAALRSSVSQLRQKAEEGDAIRKMLIKELREIELSTEYKGYDGVLSKVAKETKGVNDRFVDKLFNFPGDLSTVAFVKVLRALENEIS